MDLDSFSAARESRWNRLRDLTRRRRLTGAQSDELARLYVATAADLSEIRSSAPEPTLISRLSVLLAGSRVWLTGAHTASTGDVRRFLTVTMPAALFRVRWWGVAVAIVVCVVGTLSAWWTVSHPEVLELIGTPDDRASIANEQFASYYVEYDSTAFAAQVWTNNALIAAQCIAFGISGIYPLYLLYVTTIQLGTAGAVMAEADALDVFFALIIPHGLLELSAVFVAAGAGLRLFWTMLVPGPRTRARALGEEGRISFAVAGALTIALFASGLIEGYITGSTLAWWLKIAIGALACAAFWIVVFVAGRRAVEAGASGDSEADFASATAPVAG